MLEKPVNKESKGSRKAAAEIPQWKKLQIIVSHIEKAIGRECEVIHEDWMMDRRTNPPTPRQIDVAIRVKQASRTLVMIVEVQKRKKKVDFPTLDQWISKTRGVGANRLVCVSEKGYTKTAVELARHHGDFVDLFQITPHDGTPPEIPKLEMQIGAPQWRLVEVGLLLDREAETPAEKGNCGSGQFRLDDSRFVLHGRFFTALKTFTDMIGFILAVHFRAILRDNATVDVVIGVDPVGSFQFRASEGMLRVRWLGFRLQVVVAKYDAEAADFLQYRNVLTGTAEGYYFSSVAKLDDGSSVSVDLAVAPAKENLIASMVLPSADTRRPSIGDRFAFRIDFPVQPLQVEIHVHSGAAPDFSKPTLRDLPTVPFDSGIRFGQ